MRKQRQSRSKPEGKCNTCGQKFKRNRFRQRKCDSCWKANKFKCADCKRVYIRRDDVRVCSKCLPKVKKRFQELAVPATKVRDDGTIIVPTETDRNTDALLTKIGDSTNRGRGIDVGVGGSKHLILASELASPDQRGDDALDAEFADNQQEQAEMTIAMPTLHPQKVLAPADVTESLDSDSSWLSQGIDEARVQKHIGWFLTTPTGIVRQQTGLHQQTIARWRKQLRTDCPELVAKAVSVETAKMIEEALTQQRAQSKLRAGAGL